MANPVLAAARPKRIDAAAHAAVELAPHATAWAEDFARERERIRAVLAALAHDVQHVGSTAVPNLHAQPVIDIAVAVARSEDSAQAAAACIPLLKPLGYRELGLRAAWAGRPLERRDGQGLAYRVHLLEAESPHFEDGLLVRDHLRSNVAARCEYQVIKQTLALRHAHDPSAYAADKAAAIAQLVVQAHVRRAFLKARVRQPGGRERAVPAALALLLPPSSSSTAPSP